MAEKSKLRTKAKKAVTTGKPLTAKDKEVKRLSDNVEHLYQSVTGIPKPPLGEKRDPKDTRKFIDGLYKDSAKIGQTTPSRFQQVMAMPKEERARLPANDPISRAIGKIKARKLIGSLGFRGAWN